jgi:hypothetical protein
VKKAWEGSKSSLSQGLDGLGGDATSATSTNNCHSLLVNGANQLMMDMICAREQYQKLSTITLSPIAKNKR